MASQRRVPLAIFNPIRFHARVRLPHFLLTAVLGVALPSPALFAQSKKGLWKPPIAVATNVSVWRGDRINITLRGFQGNNPVAYEIARTPQHGSLSPVVQPDPDRVSLSTDGSIIYAHDNSDDSVDDTFTFRARGVRGGGVSAPATVRISIMDRPPVLAAPAVLDFQAAAGETMTRSLGLTNVGGGFLQIDCRTKPPFEVPGNDVIELPRGASTNVLIRYAPTTSGEDVRETLQPGINDSTGAQIVLRGQSLAPFDLGSAGGEFALDGLARASSVNLLSLATEQQEVAVTTEPPGLVEVESPVVKLEPGGSQIVRLLIPAERKGERQEVTVIFATPFHRREVSLVAPPVPAKLDVITTQLDYTGRSNTATLAVTNAGGVTGRFHLSPAPGLKFTGGSSVDAREFEVRPDALTSIDISLDVPPGAEPPTELLVDLGAGAPRIIPVIAAPPEPKPSPTVTTVTTPPPPPPSKPWKLNRSIRVAEQSTELPSLEWKTAGEAWQEPQLEVYRDGRWVPYTAPAPPRGIIERIGDWVSEFFGNLVPNREVPPTNDEPPLTPEWTVQGIDNDSAENKGLRWRITAKKGAAGKRQPVSEDFTVDWEAKTLIKAEQVAEPTATPATSLTSPTTSSANPTPTTGVRQLARALKVESARADPQRDSATVQVIFPRDPEANGYRLEHGFNPTLQDQSTGLPYPGDFRAHPHPSARAQVAGVAEIEHEGRELTVLVAAIEGLDPGTSTTWRVVTMKDGQDRWPTGEFIVGTLPPWQFPWRQATLVAAFVALAAVLYLRWRINRAPR